MALDLPATADDVVQRSRTDIQRELAGSNPFLPESWLGALSAADANRIFDFYIQLQQAINLSFPDTTSGEHLDRWASIFGVSRLAATQSSGNVVVTGTATTVISLSTSFESSDGISYLSTSASTIEESILPVTTIIPSGNIATVTTDVDHGIASNVPVTIAGADQSEYNGVQIITVTAANQFEFTITGTPAAGTGTITATFTSASVPVQSVDFDTEDDPVNQPLDAILTLGITLPSVDNDASVDFDGLEGGVPQESDEDLKVRLLDRIQNPIAHFSVADIVAQAKQIAGVTRVFVESVTPAVGQVTVYFMRDNDDDPIPSASEVTTVKDKLIEILPANTAEPDLIVASPSAIPTNFSFSSITPNTLTMQSAILASLEQFFTEETEVGVNVDEDKYRAAIINTIDTETGDELETFILSSPNGDIVIATGQIATIGAVTF